MRSMKVYGIKDGGAEQYVDTVYSAAEGKQVHVLMKLQGHFDEMVVRDALGGKQMHRDLRVDQSLMQPA